MTYATIPGDCIDRVTSENGDRVLCERIENSKATAHGNVGTELAKPAAALSAAAAAVHFWNKRPKLLETRAEKRWPSGSARRFETHHRSGPSIGKPSAIQFSHGCDSSRWWRHRHEHTSKWWREKPSYWKSKNRFKQICIREDLAKENMVRHGERWTHWIMDIQNSVHHVDATFF